MTKTILTDVDGVLLNWNQKFEGWMADLGYEKPDVPQDTYSLAECWDLPKPIMDHLVREFNKTSHTAFLRPYGDSPHYISRLAEKGYRFITITSFGGNESSQALRRYNLESVFGPVFREHHILDLCASKYNTLKEWKGEGLWWLEDNVKNAEDGLALGLRPILMRHSYNADYENDGMLMADNWRQVYAYITGEKHD